MELVSRIDELKSETDLLAHAIDDAERNERWDDAINLKRQFHEKKLEMIEELDSDSALASTITARQLRQQVQSRPNVPRYETGVSAIDAELKGGIEVGTFVQLAGESFAGKTHLCLEILANIAKHRKTLFFNFEMGEKRIDDRFSKLLHTDEQWDNFLVNGKARKLNDIVKEIRNQARTGIKFFAIDSKMKIEVPEEPDDLKAFRKISNYLSKLAQQEEIIVFLINQMNEEDQKTGRLAFKGGGDQMYDADIALFYMVKKDKQQKPEQWQRVLVCRKNRQDERLFSVDLKLTSEGKTVGTNEAEVYEYHVDYKNSDGTLRKKEWYSMPTIGS